MDDSGSVSMRKSRRLHDRRRRLGGCPCNNGGFTGAAGMSHFDERLDDGGSLMSYTEC